MSFLGDVFGGVGSVVGDVTGSGATANAIGNTAMSQQDYANQWRSQTLGFAAPTSAELAGQQQYLQLALSQNQNYQDQVAQQAMYMGKLNPIITDAFLQASQIAQGGPSSYTSPYLKQMQIQQQQLQNSLQAQMGAGYGSSSAGIQASAQFANQQSLGYMDLQGKAINELLGLGTTGASVLNAQGNLVNSTAGSTSSINNSYLAQLGAIQARQTNASMGTNATQYQGGQYAGDIYRGNAQQEAFGQFFGGLASQKGQSAGQSALFSAFSSGAPAAAA